MTQTALIAIQPESLGQAGTEIRLNDLWRARRGLLPDKFAAWGDDRPATGDIGVVTAVTPGKCLWVRFRGDLTSTLVHFDESEVVG